MKARKFIKDFCSKEFFRYQQMSGVIPPEYVCKRLRNHHLPGHSEILTYAFHNQGIVSKSKIRACFDHDTLLSETKLTFAKLKENLNTFIPIKVTPKTWELMNKKFIYSLLQKPSGEKVCFLNNREEL
jgi:hypothetical protein